MHCPRVLGEAEYVMGWSDAPPFDCRRVQSLCVEAIRYLGIGPHLATAAW